MDVPVQILNLTVRCTMWVLSLLFTYLTNPFFTQVVGARLAGLHQDPDEQRDEGGTEGNICHQVGIPLNISSLIKSS